LCTVVLSIGSSRDWPLLLAANRDEKLDRHALPPAYHWPDQPDVLGGLDVLAGGTWLAINGHGVVAAVLNRSGTLGPAPGKRSRGALPLIALRHANAQSAATALAKFDGRLWRSFNLVVADAHGAFCIRGTGKTQTQIDRMTNGVHMITAHDPNDLASPRIARNLPLFQEAHPPNPPDWGTWPALISDGAPPLESAINVPVSSGFGTVSSALVALSVKYRSHFLISETAPSSDSFRDISK
jgi:hypothetical protein